MNNGLPFKNVPSNIINHPIEKRGFVSVPLDYTDPNSKKIDVFYRLLPAYNSSTDDRTKPIIVVMNGGPGYPSSVYRPIDFDYQTSSSKNESFDRFKYFLQTHRILLVDQRGTDGYSAPLDVENPSLDAEQVAKYFSSDSQARDYLAVINAMIPDFEPFFIIAQSYGGMPGMQYLSLPNARYPNGIVFSSSGLPYEDYMKQMISRRQEQLDLNLHLQKMVPNIELTLKKVRDHFARLGIDPTQVHGLYTWLGKGTTGVWEKAFENHLKKILKQSREEMEQDSPEKFGEVNLLNYILSSANFTPGHTDRSIARTTSAQLPFEPWMLDENEIYLNVGQDGSWRGPFVDAIDRNPPKSTPFASVNELKAAIAQNSLLFTTAENDAFVPADAYLNAIEKFKVPLHTELRHLHGGHHAIFLEDGYHAFLDWSKDKIR